MDAPRLWGCSQAVGVPPGGRARALSSNLFRGLPPIPRAQLQQAGVCAHRCPHSPFPTPQHSELLKRTLLRHRLSNARPSVGARLPFIRGPFHSAFG